MVRVVSILGGELGVVAVHEMSGVVADANDRSVREDEAESLWEVAFVVGGSVDPRVEGLLLDEKLQAVEES